MAIIIITCTAITLPLLSEVCARKAKILLLLAVRLLTLLVVPHCQDRQDWVAIALVVVAAIIVVVLWRGGEGCRGIWKGVEEVTIKCEALSLTTDDDEGVIIMVVRVMLWSLAVLVVCQLL
jgi:hypothetical protein